MSLQERIAQIEKACRLFQEEVSAVKQEVKLLEEENLRLRRQLCQAVEGDYARVQENSRQIRGTAKESLSALYSTNFHICHLFFGRSRQGECLFCVAMLGD